MKKIFVVFGDDTARRIYTSIFSQEPQTKVLEFKSGTSALEEASKEFPSMVLLDGNLKDMQWEKFLERLRAREETKRTPVVFFSYGLSPQDKDSLLKFEVKDVVDKVTTVPREGFLKVKQLLGEQKTYRIPVSLEEEKIKELAKDLGYPTSLRCPSCGSGKVMYLMQDYGKGSSYFKISFICPSCGK